MVASFFLLVGMPRTSSIAMMPTTAGIVESHPTIETEMLAERLLMMLGKNMLIPYMAVIAKKSIAAKIRTFLFLKA